MKSKLISKILGVGVAASTVIALGGALVASPVAADTTKWTSINTPNWEDGVILPASDILDYDISGEDGNVVYVVAIVDRTCADANPFLTDDIDADPGAGEISIDYGVFKSTNGGVTWKDITQNVLDATNLPGPVQRLDFVAVAPDDEDWVTVTGYGAGGTSPVVTVASKDGGDNFAYAGDMEATNGPADTIMTIVFDTEVSPETAGDTCAIHVIAVMGMGSADSGGAVFRLDAGTWLTGSWEDTSFYDGWDGDVDGNGPIVDPDDINSLCIIDGEFSPNFTDDFTFVVIGVAGTGPYLPYVQTGDFESKQWGEEASMPDPVQIKAGGDELTTGPYLWSEGIALPADYDGSDPGARVVFGYVDGTDTITGKDGGFVFRLDNSDVSPQVAPSGNPILASIAVSGDADTGKMMIGEYGKWEGRITPAEPCAGVKVWHTEELDICCPKWELCCKCPSGTYAARVAYTPDGTKEYATTTSSTDGLGFELSKQAGLGTPGDESAFSVSLDDATSWNQIGLIDTNINELSDMVICPDCSVMYLSTINSVSAGTETISAILYPCDTGSGCVTQGWWFNCDSVWRSFDNGKTWERVNHGNWTDVDNSVGNPDFIEVDDTDDIHGDLLLRLPCEDLENCCDYSDPSAPGGTVYLGVQWSDDLFYSRDCGQCWTETPDTKIEIQDFAVDTESTVYVLDIDGNVSKSTNFGRRWADAVDTGAGSGHMITVCCAQGMVVVGPQNWEGGDAVAWSDDAGDSWNTTDDIPVNGEVHVACATTCENIIYIATYYKGGGIWRGDLTDGSWTDMNAIDTGYTGIAVGKSDGTLYASTNSISWGDCENPCNRFGSSTGFTDDQQNGNGIEACLRVESSAVARNLTPCETACCGTEDWDYLVCGLTEYDDCFAQNFRAEVNALDICGCLTSATNTKLYSIDSGRYDMRDGDNGTIWTYEDCASKVGPTLLAPADGTVLDCMACEDCSAQPFTLKWDRLCNSCSYDIEIMDEDGNVVNSLVDIELTGTGSCSFVFNPQNSEFSDFFGELVCGSTYKWRVREANTTCECIHSQWSATWSFTVATSSANGVKLIAPKMAAADTGTANIGFSWSSVPGATSYSFVLSPNANLSGALVSQEIGTTAFNYAGPLENGKTYYWQVKAWKGTTLLSTSPIGVFTVGPKPMTPPPPTVVEQTPPPQVNIPPAQRITPTWIYAAIGIGIALVVVVIVLVVRTRRP